MRNVIACMFLVTLVSGLTLGQNPKSEPLKTPPKYDPKIDTKDYPDSYRYYGPNGLWKTWTPEQKAGRDTWIFWTGGNQKFFRQLAVLAGNQPIPISVDFLRMLDSRRRATRFKDLGLINEPNCESRKEGDPDEYGLYLDKWKGDPLDYYPTQYGEKETVSKAYGESTGVVGLRKFPNLKFDKSRWNVDAYFQNPGKVEPPYLIGFSCAFCHIAFDPTRPPLDPEQPRWENLAANIGNQYFREGELFLGKGRVVFGNFNPDPSKPNDPYATKGLTAKDLLWHYAVTQQHGTSETSRISYDFINNPNTINGVFNLANRTHFSERGPDGRLHLVNHILKDGADSVGVETAILRVWINIGCEGRYWLDSLFNPATGQRQKPLDIDSLRLAYKTSRTREEETRLKTLKAEYGQDFGEDWAEAWRRNPNLVSYLASYTAYHLADAKLTEAERKSLTEKKLLPDADLVAKGKVVFADHCAECHSNTQPGYLLNSKADRQQYYRQSVLATDFLTGNTLSDDRRYSVLDLGTNIARALATNAVDGDIWAELSSKEYKALPPVGKTTFEYTLKPVPVGGQAVLTLAPKTKKDPANPKADISIPFTPLGGGRGYYRTPMLIGVWNSAPFLHNNSVGDYVTVRADGSKVMTANDGSFFEDRIDVSVEGRLRMYEDAMKKLLWPETRRGYIKRISEDCSILPVMPQLLSALPGVVENWIFDLLDSKLNALVDRLLQEAHLSGPFATLLRPILIAEAKKGIQELRGLLKFDNLVDFKAKLTEMIGKKLLAKALEAKLDNTPLPQVAKDKIKEYLGSIQGSLLEELDTLLALDERKLPRVLQIPKGTPVNLYLNLSASAIPYAVLAHIKHKSDPRGLLEALLKLSDCPDLVEDRGHEYGSKLPDADKQALIEFLKTF